MVGIGTCDRTSQWGDNRVTIQIFYFEGSDGGFERWLELEDDGSLTYSTSPNYYAAKSGAKREFERLSVAEAKERWPYHAESIDRALARLTTEKSQIRTLPSFCTMLSKSSDERIERYKQEQQNTADAHVQEQQRADEERVRNDRFQESVREKWAKDLPVIREILKDIGAGEKLGGQFELTELGASPSNNVWRGRLNGRIGNQPIIGYLTIDEHGQLQAPPPQMGGSYNRIHGANPLNVLDATKERYEHFFLDLLDISTVSFTDD